MKKQNSESYTITSQMFKSLFPPQIIAAIVPALTTLIDTIVVGNFFSAEALAAIGFVAPINFIFTAFGCVMSSGLSIVVGNYIGRGDYKKINPVYTTTLIVSVIISILFIAMSFMFTKPILSAFGVTEDIMDMSKQYFLTLSIGALPAFLNPVYIVMLNLGNNTKFATKVACIIAATNLIFSVLPVIFFGSKIIYIGLASSLSVYIGLLCFIFKLKNNRNIAKLEKKSFKFGYLKQILYFGLPSSLNWFFAAVRLAILNRALLVVCGIPAVSAYSVFNSAGTIFCVTINGSSATVRFISSVAVGEQDCTGLKNLIKTWFRIALPVNIASALVFAVLAKPIGIVFGVSGVELDYLKICVFSYSIALCLELVCDTWITIYSSLGRSGYVSRLNFYIMILFPFFICLLGKTVSSIWIVMLTYFFAAVAAIVVMFVVSCIRNSRLSRTVMDTFWLGEEFNLEKNKKMSISVSDKVSATNVSAQIIDFCSQFGIDKKHCFYAGLCIEEMAVNIAERGFLPARNKDENSTIDILVSVYGDTIKIRLRDNAPFFNPIERLEMYKEDPNDIFANIGIRIVAGVAKQMNYKQVFGMNVLTLDL